MSKTSFTTAIDTVIAIMEEAREKKKVKGLEKNILEVKRAKINFEKIVPEDEVEAEAEAEAQEEAPKGQSLNQTTVEDFTGPKNE